MEGMEREGRERGEDGKGSTLHNLRKTTPPRQQVAGYGPVLGGSKLGSYLPRLWTKVHQLKCACSGVGLIVVSNSNPFFRLTFLVAFRRYSRSVVKLYEIASKFRCF